jgi:hypothetical protein
LKLFRGLGSFGVCSLTESEENGWGHKEAASEKKEEKNAFPASLFLKGAAPVCLQTFSPTFYIRSRFYKTAMTKIYGSI